MKKITKDHKKELINGKEFSFADDFNENNLEFWHETGGPNWKHEFQLMFNGEQKGYRTFDGFANKINQLIEAHELKNQADEDI